MSNSDIHNDANTPYWMRLFTQVGFPTALAIVLVAALLGWMPSPIMQAISRLEYNSWQQTRILRTICHQSSGGDLGGRAACEPWKPEVER